MKVWLIKPAIDTRDGECVVKSRIGLFAPCDAIDKSADVFEMYIASHGEADVIIADECQFFTAEQIDQLRRIVDERNTPVLCFGLRTDFLCHLFTGSRRLFEIADSISEIKTICACGAKATVNARLDRDMRVVTEGSQVMLGGNETYIAMCHRCWRETIKKQSEKGEL